VSFLDTLLNRNPTKLWRARHGLALVLDLDNETFCGVRLGDRADRLEQFGPAEDAKRAREGVLRYDARGFEIWTEENRFTDVMLQYGIALHTPFAGTVRRRGAEASFTPETTEAELVRFLGAPDEREVTEATDEMSGGVDLAWSLANTDLEADFIDDRLDEIWLTRRD